MCIAILQTTKEPIDYFTFETCQINNPDGMGLLYSHNGLKVHKELYNLEKIYDLYLKALKLTSVVAIHFRIGTSGTVSKKCCHPFFVNKNLAFMHNGILDIEPAKGLNDTMTFNRDVLKHLPNNFLNNKGIVALLGEYCGNSKLIFLDKWNNWYIINERLGHWNDGIWYSNNTYLYTYKTKPPVIDTQPLYNSDKKRCSVCGFYLYKQEEEVCSYCIKGYDEYEYSTRG